MSEFEYDPEKSDINLLKHGINFEEAKILWEDKESITIPLEFKSEKRYAVIGKIEDKYWTAIVTFRKKSTRIISIRRSRKREVLEYERRRI